MKITQLVGGESQIELDKRQHIPVHVEDECPKCGNLEKWDLSQGGGKNGNHLSYPSVNTPEPLRFTCEKCEHEWSRNVIVRMTLEAV